MNNIYSSRTIDMIQEMRKQGTQYCIDFIGCNEKLLNSSEYIKNLIDKAVKYSGMVSITKTKIHKFEPFGVTGYALLACSHIAIHTWPEYGYASIDVFACDKRQKVLDAVAIITDGLQPNKKKVVIIKRGYYEQER